MFYGPAVWDPWLIISQMVIMQTVFYIVVGSVIFGCSLAFKTPLSLAVVLSSKSISWATPSGWVSAIAFLSVAPICGVLLMHVVGRAKKCLDFGSTVYIFHFLLCVVYDGFPRNWEWWIVNTTGAIIMVVLAERLCMRREMEDIPRLDIMSSAPTSPRASISGAVATPPVMLPSSPGSASGSASGSGRRKSRVYASQRSLDYDDDDLLDADETLALTSAPRGDIADSKSHRAFVELSIMSPMTVASPLPPLGSSLRQDYALDAISLSLAIGTPEPDRHTQNTGSVVLPPLLLPDLPSALRFSRDPQSAFSPQGLASWPQS